MLIVLLNTGMRWAEMCNMTWDSVDFDRLLITISDSKSGKRRHIPINNNLLQTLRKLEKEPRSIKGHVFYNPRTGYPFDSVKNAFKKSLGRAGIQDFRVHDLCHTFASHLVIEGVSLFKVARLLGHSTMVITERYAHLAPKHNADAVAVLDSQYSNDIGHILDTLVVQG